MKTILKTLFLVIALTAFPVFAQIDFEATKARAEQGDATAQHNLGVMYATGEGAAENDQEAVKWYRLAAEQGDATAQSNLGVMYFNGEGVAQNDQRAYVWFSVAAAQGLPDAASNRDRARNRLAPQALEQAQATRCFESKFKDCD